MADSSPSSTRPDPDADEGPVRPSGIAVFVVDPDGVITTWSAPARDRYGYDAADVLGRELTVLLSADGRRDASLPGLLSGAADGAYEAPGWHRRADGSVFRATLTLVPLWDDGLSGYAVLSGDGTAESQHIRELERRNDRLKEFTDALAHDLRSPLGIIESRLDLYDETGEQAHLDSVRDATERMRALVDDLLQVARHDAEITDRQEIDIERVIETAWEGTGGQSPGATLSAEPIGTVRGDADRLCQLFENLFRNSVKHGGEGTVTVRVGPLENGIYVEDDGPGIPEELREDVFDHGVTTTADGTGYGLSIVRTIAEAHGWDVGMTDTDSGGARFEITGVETGYRRGVND